MLTHRRILVVVVSASCGCLAGCSHVVAHPTPYYKDGPSQLAQPQGRFDEGTMVLILGKEGSYAHVWASNFVNAWVWEGALESVWSYRKPKETDWQEEFQPDDSASIEPDEWKKQ